MPYRTLDSEKIVDTARKLQQRVAERFPDSGLGKVAAEIAAVGETINSDAKELSRPVWWLRLVIVATVVAGALVFVFVGTFMRFDRMESGTFDLIQGIEATINTLVLTGIGLLALMHLEERFKRQRVLKKLHTLRSLIHVIDMHQLTKDPSVLTGKLKPTASSPKRLMGADELKRYLDYCSEMLSITAKYAALYAQAVNDAVVIEAVNDIESLSTNLSRKIWQKIMLIAGDGMKPPPE
jgi:hypothetical protein